MSPLPSFGGRLGSPPDCSSCGAGSLISFAWPGAPELLPAPSVFVTTAALRDGTLYACWTCRRPWYLTGVPAVMNSVPEGRLDLIRRWNEGPITLPSEHARTLKAIGPSPAATYVSGREYCEVPCRVTTTDGVRHDLAIVSIQQHAPFEGWRDCRLASDIARIEPSPYALSRAVRRTTAKARERAMGFAPTPVSLPTGEVVVLNGAQNFFVRSGVEAANIVVARERPDPQTFPAPTHDELPVVYFIADGPRLGGGFGFMRWLALRLR